MINSFQLIRTNCRLTTNYKIVVDSNYKLYLESFNSSKDLSNEKYKHYLLNDSVLLENELPKFYDKLPKNISFSPIDESDVDIMYNSYNNQFDDMYFAGAKNIEDNWYKEEFEYFAPLYIKKNKLPNNFIILRVDDPMIYDIKGDNYESGHLKGDNFKKEIIDKWRCVKVFDLSNNNSIGIFFDNNINNNDRFPDFSLFFDTKKYNYSKWAGMSYDNGIYTSSDLMLDDKLYQENLHFDLEEFITKGFEKNGIIYPYILNLKFLFDDEPADPDKLKKYSINRYYGFYADKLDLIDTITSFKLDTLRNEPNMSIKNNIFVFGEIPTNPFRDNRKTEGWIKYKNNIYKVKKLNNGNYKIISDVIINTTDMEELSSNSCTINYINGKNIINISNLNIDEYVDDNNNVDYMYADLYLIEIDGIYHVLRSDKTLINGIYNHIYYIDTDYAIVSNELELKYWKGGQKEIIKKIQNGINEKPIIYPIYRVKFSDIKDFDFDRINTKYSDFDYEKTTYKYTPEIKLYSNEYRDYSNPRRKKEHDVFKNGQFNKMIISSEYISGDELFEINDNNLNDIWKKNQTICKWGYDGSISHCDYQYKINNNINIGGVYNRTTNTDLEYSSIDDKTHDYFYRIGNFYKNREENGIMVKNDVFYYNQTTNIQTNLLSTDSIRFNLDNYISNNYDYFEYFFNNKMNYEYKGIIYSKKYLKYSTFNNGDSDVPSSSLFKGIEYNLYSVDDIIKTTNNKEIKKILVKGGEKYNNYKLSVILSDNYTEFEFDYQNNEYINGTKIGNIKKNAVSTSLNILNEDKNGIHVFLNEKYKNILIIINVNIPINKEWMTLNNIDIFGENHGLYFGETLNGFNILPSNVDGYKRYDPDLITAFNYISSMNNLNDESNFDQNITYHMITNSNGLLSCNFKNLENSNFDLLENWNKKYPPFLLSLNSPDIIKLKKNSYKVYPIKGPSYNIYDKYLVYNNKMPLSQSLINEPMARFIEINQKDDVYGNIKHGEKVSNTNEIKRFIGYYEPIFKNIEVFNSVYYNNINENNITFDTNYKFDTSLTNFGCIDELMYSKVNENGNYLKLKDISTDRSIYPITDEIGLSQTKRMIFLSTWDSEFFIRTLNEHTMLSDFVLIKGFQPDFINDVQLSAWLEGELSNYEHGFKGNLNGNGVTITYNTHLHIQTITYGNMIYIFGYGKNNPSNKLKLKVNVKNLSTLVKNLKITSKIDNTNISTGTTINSVTYGAVESITLEMNRPSEITNHNESDSGILERSTLYNLKVTCQEIDSNGDVLTGDTAINNEFDDIKFMVYNDLIHYETFDIVGITENNTIYGDREYNITANVKGEEGKNLISSSFKIAGRLVLNGTEHKIDVINLTTTSAPIIGQAVIGKEFSGNYPGKPGVLGDIPNSDFYKEVSYNIKIKNLQHTGHINTSAKLKFYLYHSYDVSDIESIYKIEKIKEINIKYTSTLPLSMSVVNTIYGLNNVNFVIKITGLNNEDDMNRRLNGMEYYYTYGNIQSGTFSSGLGFNWYTDGDIAPNGYDGEGAYTIIGFQPILVNTNYTLHYKLLYDNGSEIERTENFRLTVDEPPQQDYIELNITSYVEMISFNLGPYSEDNTFSKTLNKGNTINIQAAERSNTNTVDRISIDVEILDGTTNAQIITYISTSSRAISGLSVSYNNNGQVIFGAGSNNYINVNVNTNKNYSIIIRYGSHQLPKSGNQ